MTDILELNPSIVSLACISYIKKKQQKKQVSITEVTCGYWLATNKANLPFCYNSLSKPLLQQPRISSAVSQRVNNCALQ